MFVLFMRAVAPAVAAVAAWQLTSWLFQELDHIHDHNHENAERIGALEAKLGTAAPAGGVESTPSAES